MSSADRLSWSKSPIQTSHVELPDQAVSSTSQLTLTSTIRPFWLCHIIVSHIIVQPQQDGFVSFVCHWD
jgi:hypothetical protein